MGEGGGAYAQLQPSVSPRPSRLSPERPLPAGLGLRVSLQRLLLPSHHTPGTSGAWRGGEWWERDHPFFTVSLITFRPCRFQTGERKDAASSLPPRGDDGRKGKGNGEGGCVGCWKGGGRGGGVKRL